MMVTQYSEVQRESKKSKKKKKKRKFKTNDIIVWQLKPHRFQPVEPANYLFVCVCQYSHFGGQKPSKSDDSLGKCQGAVALGHESWWWVRQTRCAAKVKVSEGFSPHCVWNHTNKFRLEYWKCNIYNCLSFNNLFCDLAWLCRNKTLHKSQQKSQLLCSYGHG